MTRYLILIIALALASGAKAQKIEPIPTSEQTRFMQMPVEQRTEWQKKYHSETNMNNYRLRVLPEKILAGDTLDLYYSAIRSDGGATIELFRLEGTRRKRILRKNFTPREGESFSIMLWVTVDQPGQYEIEAYQNSSLSQSNNMEPAVSYRSFEVLPPADN